MYTEGGYLITKILKAIFGTPNQIALATPPPLFSTYIQNSEGVGPWHKLHYARHCSQAMAGLVRLDHYGSRARASLIKMALRVEPA